MCQAFYVYLWSFQKLWNVSIITSILQIWEHRFRMKLLAQGHTLLCRYSWILVLNMRPATAKPALLWWDHNAFSNIKLPNFCSEQAKLEIPGLNRKWKSDISSPGNLKKKKKSLLTNDICKRESAAFKRGTLPSKRCGLQEVWLLGFSLVGVTIKPQANCLSLHCTLRGHQWLVD